MPNSKELHTAIGAAIHNLSSPEELCETLSTICEKGGGTLKFTAAEASSIYTHLIQTSIVFSSREVPINPSDPKRPFIVNLIEIFSHFEISSIRNELLEHTAVLIDQQQSPLDLESAAMTLYDLPRLSKSHAVQHLVASLTSCMVKRRQEGKILTPWQIIHSLQGLRSLTYGSDESNKLTKEILVQLKCNSKQAWPMTHETSIGRIFRGLNALPETQHLEALSYLLPHILLYDPKIKQQRFACRDIASIMHGLQSISVNHSVLQILTCLANHIEHMEHATGDRHRDEWMSSGSISDTLHGLRNMMATAPEAQNIINRFLEAILPHIETAEAQKMSLSIGQTRKVLEGLANFPTLSAANKIIGALKTHLSPPRFFHQEAFAKLITDTLFQLGSYFDDNEESQQVAIEFVNALTTRFPKTNARTLKVQLELLKNLDTRRSEIIRMGHFIDHEAKTLDLSECSPQLATMLCDDLLANWHNAEDTHTSWTIKLGSAIYDKDQHASKMRSVVESTLEQYTETRLSHQWEKTHVTITTGTGLKRTLDENLQTPPGETDSETVETEASPPQKKPKMAEVDTSTVHLIGSTKS